MKAGNSVCLNAHLHSIFIQWHAYPYVLHIVHLPRQKAEAGVCDRCRLFGCQLDHAKKPHQDKFHETWRPGEKRDTLNFDVDMKTLSFKL